MNYKHFSYLLLLFAFGCGGSQKEASLSIMIDAAYSSPGFIEANLPDSVQVESFRIQISADDIEAPIEVIVPRTQRAFQVQNIPEGFDRNIIIEALNADRIPVRKQVINKVAIKQGEELEIQTSLRALPILTQPTHRGIITEKQISLRGIAEPYSNIEIALDSEGIETILVEVNAEGNFETKNVFLSAGSKNFILTDLNSGEDTKTSFMVTRPENQRGQTFSYMKGVNSSYLSQPGASHK